MRDCRNVLHARLATTRKEQKHNCGGTSDHAEKARDQPARKPKRENLPVRLFFRGTMKGSDAIRNRYPTYDPPRTAGRFRTDCQGPARAALERVAIPTSGDSKAAGSAGRRQPDSR